jgi:hypothetical protein
MTLEQNAQLTMCRAVRICCNGNTAAWTGSTVFSTAFAEFEAELEGVESLIGQQGIVSTGTTLAKSAVRHTLEGQVMHIADTLVLHFKMVGDQQDRHDLFTSRSVLERMGDEAFSGRATRIISMAADVTPAALTALGLDPAELTAASNNLTSFINMIGKPRDIRGLSKQGTKKLGDAIASLMHILVEDMDVAAHVLQYSKPDFFFLYQSAREITDPGYSTRELTVNVTGGESGLAGAQAVITPGDIHKVTGKKGTFFINNMNGGTYTVVLTANGFKPKTVPFNIVDGQATVLNVAMEVE